MQAACDIIGRKASLPPLGLITVAALCPGHWELRLIDEMVQPVTDQDLAWCDLMMVSAMAIQGEAVARILNRARDCGKRTVIGGPYAASHTQELSALADHVVSGEVEEHFAEIARKLEDGTAEPVTVITTKPDVTLTPAPRFDLLQLDAYTGMSVQFSRGCPFQCEFCDIIVLYGRKPRTKSPAQLIAEFDGLRKLGWAGDLFIVDDNFIGNHIRAAELCKELRLWQQKHGSPFVLYTEASVNLAQRQELIDLMVAANFQYVFLGIETPSADSLKETRKFQNIPNSLVESVHTLLKGGLWVMGGFIVGFDADDESIFERQQEFIEQAAIPWAMVGMLQALRRTALHERLQREGRLLPENEVAGNNLSIPNFQTNLSQESMIRGYCQLLEQLYSPAAYFARVRNSLQLWQTRPEQRPPKLPWSFKIKATLSCLWHLGVKSHYRLEFWKSLGYLLWAGRREPAKVVLGFAMLLSGSHMIGYSASLVKRYRKLLEHLPPEPSRPLQPVG